MGQVWKYAVAYGDVMTKFKVRRVECENQQSRPLSTTYIPTQKLLFCRNRYMLPGGKFPFIKLQDPLSSSKGLGPWAFLESDFGVSTEESLEFYLDILCCIQESSNPTPEIPHRVLELYLRIHAVCEASDDTAAAQEKVRYAFDKHDKSVWKGKERKGSQLA
ncbi:hypothetical protein EDB80DRAFT_782529 [Ilyonectria destructans]|nr:hypothetical protein EDB80DRAFT_782529 [Ilyonectria destructans]